MATGGRKQVPAGLFKQGCLALIDDVASSETEIVITKRGKPVARLVPIEDPEDRARELLARWRGKARQLVDDADLLAPSNQLTHWQALDE
jgi:prevent-host-death family protein